MAILSWRTSWMTVSRSVQCGSRSTSGRAPSINSIIRFWISAVSLNRPPTLFTISSLLSASIIVLVVSSSSSKSRPENYLQSARPLVVDDRCDLVHRPFQVIVDHHVIERVASLGHLDLAPSRAIPLLDVFRMVPTSIVQPLPKCRPVRRQDKDEQRT